MGNDALALVMVMVAIDQSYQKMWTQVVLQTTDSIFKEHYAG
jgi:hypothetical protein